MQGEGVSRFFQNFKLTLIQSGKDFVPLMLFFHVGL